MQVYLANLPDQLTDNQRDALRRNAEELVKLHRNLGNDIQQIMMEEQVRESDINGGVKRASARLAALIISEVRSFSSR